MEKSQMRSATLPTVEKQVLIRRSFAWNSGLKAEDMIKIRDIILWSLMKVQEKKASSIM